MMKSTNSDAHLLEKSMRFINRIVTDPKPGELPHQVIPVVAQADKALLLRILKYLWASPTTAVAFPIVFANAMRGGETLVWHGVIEIQGPVVRSLLSRREFQAAALTLGHVILCADDDARNRFRAHELVHVQQTERWGPLFLPVYLGLTVLTWRRTGHGYWFHPWEIEARKKSGI
jgi:hypothetical protein